MTTILEYLSAHRSGILTGILVLLALACVVQWVLWMFGWGRFSGARGTTTIRYVLAEFFVQIVNDFRHLLALVLVGIFTVMMLIATLPSVFRQGGPDLTSMKDGFQAVAAALGGLIGSIVGYYFGESAAARRSPPETPEPEAPQSLIQGAPPTGGAAGAPVRPVVPPSGSSGAAKPEA